jgi:transposase-like protein
MNAKGNKTRVASNKSQVVRDIPMACSNEHNAVEFLEKQRWDGEAFCPECGSIDVYQMQDSNTGNRQKNYRWRCHDCHKQFTVRTGTVLEDSRIPLRFWCLAFYRACTSKKGVSALQIRRETGLSYKSALFLMHRVRYAMAEPIPSKLDGIVEVDETYVGGKPRRDGKYHKRGRGTSKAPVVALVERNGRVRSKPIANVTGKTLKDAIRDNVEKTACIMTDEHTSYRGIGKEFAGGHHTVNHGRGEYARGIVHSNSAESFFALLKRGVYGTYHAVSKKHLHRYVSEFAFRWNTRKQNDGDRLVAAIRGARGKRLMYREPLTDKSVA